MNPFTYPSLLIICTFFAIANAQESANENEIAGEDIFSEEAINDFNIPATINESEKRLLERQKNNSPQITKPEIIANKRMAGWQSITFNINNAQLRNELKAMYPWVQFNEDSYIESIEETKNFRLLKTFENAIFKSLEFQFDDEERLYLIRMQLNPRFFSFITLVSSLQNKYGKEDFISSKKLMWVGSEGVLELYRDLTIKYIRYDIRYPENDSELNQQSPLNAAKENIISSIMKGL